MKKIFIGILFLIFFLVIGYNFLFKPFLVAARNAVAPFEYNQQLLCDKVTYIFRAPQKYDRIIFSGQGQQLIGVIDDLEIQGTQNRYFVSSINQGKQWEIFSSDIECHVWYPIL